ncbi:MAG: FAD-linked oxidase, partial [Mesorhizobium sp.]
MVLLEPRTARMELPRQTDVPSGRSDSSITAIEQFRQGLRGELVLPKDAAYDQARRVWN